MKPRQPFVIVGGGLAGVTAAWSLRKSGYDALILEAGPRLGGRFYSRRVGKALADYGCQYLNRGNRVLVQLTRGAGIEHELATIPGGVVDVDDSGTRLSTANAYDANRVALRSGCGSLIDAIAEGISVQFDSRVSAIRWDVQDRTFWFETDGDRPVIDRTSGNLITAAGVIVATTPRAASAIAQRSVSISSWGPAFASISFQPAFVGLFVVPRVETKFYGFQTVGRSKVAWIALEEKKSPSRAPSGCSMVVSVAAPAWSESLAGLDDSAALGDLYAETRRLVPELAESPINQACKFWPAGLFTGTPLNPTELPETSPVGLPITVAGDYTRGSRAEDAAESGLAAAQRLVDRWEAFRTQVAPEPIP